jgi:hypothetical protein
VENGGISGSHCYSIISWVSGTAMGVDKDIIKD